MMFRNSEDQKSAPFFSHCQGNSRKPLEIYMFIDPLCPECWALEPVIKKLQIQYGRFFTLKHIISGQIKTLNHTKRKNPSSLAQVWEKTANLTGMSCDGTLWSKNPISTPFTASLAIKSAELQGRKAGIRFLRKLQEVLFLQTQNVTEEKVLLEIAREVGLDEEEFLKDLHSASSAKALQCDLKITAEMDVQEIPTLTFFNQNADLEGLKISGFYPYEMYVGILAEMLGDMPKPTEVPPLEIFLRYFKFVATAEIAAVYSISMEEAEKEMKKYLLAQKVERVPVKHGTFWRYIS
ncbi:MULTISPECIES: ClpXP adapter SpxH family protein [Bacillaceae]|uniref:ClpXP adapter SpxH family protein n=1 Tax=Bacillaceae TaxID=186817 RepID=UPI000C78023C|nr:MULTISPECIES: ClpXP adapter SpxH family protein [Bacillaceae]PLR68969.1 dithiol-disulfide isomerase [Bacillus sp. UMB0893]